MQDQKEARFERLEKQVKSLQRALMITTAALAVVVGVAACCKDSGEVKVKNVKLVNDAGQVVAEFGINEADVPQLKFFKAGNPEKVALFMGLNSQDKKNPEFKMFSEMDKTSIFLEADDQSAHARVRAGNDQNSEMQAIPDGAPEIRVDYHGSLRAWMGTRGAAKGVMGVRSSSGEKKEILSP